MTSSLALVTCAATLVAGGGRASPAAAVAGPQCKFSGALESVVTDAAPGKVVDISCTGFPANNPYLLVETSLLVAIDPAATPLLTGQTTSVPGLLALIAALPEMNALSVAFPTSDANGNLTYAYTIPSSQPLDPNATCPPSTQQFNSGLIGCAVAMIDLTTFKPVIAGTFVLHYGGQFFPPGPTLGLSTNIATVGQSVTISDAPGAETYWWLATLASLYANLDGGSGSGGPIPVVMRVGGRKVAGSGAVTPASYNGSVFTPPKLSGSFIARKAGRGQHVTVTLNANLLGFPLSNTAIVKLRVIK